MAEKPKRKWISKAINPAHEGQFSAKAKAAGMSTHEYAEKHKHDGDHVGKQARLALTLMSMHHGKPKHERSGAERRKALYGHAGA